MDGQGQIPAEIKRFILTSIDSVPHLEAILLLLYEPQLEWDAKMMAQRLYLNEKRASEILADLSANGFATARQSETLLYHYNTASTDLKELLDHVALIYAKNLVEVTNLIHSRINKQAQQLGDAFRWQKEKE